MFYIGQSFAFVAGPRSTQDAIIKLILVLAWDEFSKVLDQHTFSCISVGFVFSRKRDGLVHVLYAVRVHLSLYKSTTRGLAVVKRFIIIVVEILYISQVLPRCSDAGGNKSCSASRIRSIISLSPRTFSCRMSIHQGNQQSLL